MTTAYRIFVSSPADVAEGRARARRVIEWLSTEFTGWVTLTAVALTPCSRTFEPRLTPPRPAISSPASCGRASALASARPSYMRRDGSLWESATAFEIETALEAGRGGGGRAEVALFVKRALVPLDPRAPEGRSGRAAASASASASASALATPGGTAALHPDSRRPVQGREQPLRRLGGVRVQT